MNLPEPSANWALFLDFDGTIVDIAPTPASVAIPDCLPALLVALGDALGGAVAVVTGRPIEQIDGFLGTAVPAVAGLHGLERRTADGAIVHPPFPRDDLQAVRARLQAFAAARPGVLVEDKKYAVALHYRLVPSLKEACRDLVNAAVERHMAGWQVVEGKFVFEIRPRHSTKGTAIEAFMSEAPFFGRTAVFCGDDITDEDGFAVVNARGGASIRVGSRSATQAAVQVDTVGELLDWLKRIAGRAMPSRGG
ncbi:MAG: trehalose-phosphatase [Alphaproteobacteria bacterium]|nr:trehalose-phosphatase [Alphaproteobacteria bacterium]